MRHFVSIADYIDLYFSYMLYIYICYTGVNGKVYL